MQDTIKKSDINSQQFQHPHEDVSLTLLKHSPQHFVCSSLSLKQKNSLFYPFHNHSTLAHLQTESQGSCQPWGGTWPPWILVLLLLFLPLQHKRTKQQMLCLQDVVTGFLFRSTASQKNLQHFHDVLNAQN